MSNKISWTDKTWNPVHGCTKISAGCKNCYAERMSKRLAGRHGYPDTPDNFKVTLRPDRLEQPLKWRKPRRVFVCSMSDLFHEDVPFNFTDRVFQKIALSPQHTFQVLTKRPARMLKYMQQKGIKNKIGRYPLAPFQNRALPNVWLGVTVESQATADKRIPLLLQTPAAVRFVSAEPLLGPVDLENYLGIYYEAEAVTEFDGHSFYKRPGRGLQRHGGPKLDWVITGGETGPGARPSHPDWFRGLRDQCRDAGVKFHFKQHGEWLAESQGAGWNAAPENDDSPNLHCWHSENTFSVRVGNARAGNLLDGERWEQMPGESK